MKRLVLSAVLTTVAYCAEIADVPYVRQTREGCGSAAVAMVMEYWAAQGAAPRSASMDAAQIDRALPPGPKGIAGSLLRDYLDSHGFRAFVFDGELQDIDRHLKRGRPLIVCIAANGPGKPFHYVVVTGRSESTITLNDPARGRQFQEPLPVFTREWDGTGRWAMLAVPQTSR